MNLAKAIAIVVRTPIKMGAGLVTDVKQALYEMDQADQQPPLKLSREEQQMLDAMRESKHKR